MNNTKFATSLHILTLLSMESGEYLSSEYIAGSINVNAAIIRKEIGNLRAHGFVESREGKGGGNALAKPPGRIRLSEIYQAVNSSALLGRANHPNPSCPVGMQINKHIETLSEDAEKALIKQLGKQTLSQFTRQFK